MVNPFVTLSVRGAESLVGEVSGRPLGSESRFLGEVEEGAEAR